jgi:hypothetical protein
MWETISEVMGVVVKPDFESMAKWWLNDKSFNVLMYALRLYSGLYGKLQMNYVFRGPNGQGCRRR